MLEYQDSVSHHDTDQANNAQDARQAEIDMERPQAQRRPEQGEQQRDRAANAKPIFLKLTNRKKKTMITAIAKPCISGFIVSRNPAPWLHRTRTSRLGQGRDNMAFHDSLDPFLHSVLVGPRVTSAKRSRYARRCDGRSAHHSSLLDRGDLPERDAHAGDDGGKILVADPYRTRVRPPFLIGSQLIGKRNRLPRGSQPRGRRNGSPDRPRPSPS